MTELRKVLEESGVRSAVVIDDVFDEVPRSKELTNDEWNVFFDDLSDQDKRLLVEIYPQYEQTLPDKLKKLDTFVETLWKHRCSLTERACDALFGSYERENTSEKQVLDNIVDTLKTRGLQCDTMGTKPIGAVNRADLLIVDLFLGRQEHETDVDHAIELLETIVNQRSEPPLVVLTSRSGRLSTHQNSFRDRVGLLGSMFRVVSKDEISDAASLDRLLWRLAVHYRDAKRVDRFIRAWNTGMDQARKRLITKLRRLDLSDLAQIRALMLEFEGQELGEYMMEIADRVLQYEIEAVEDTISAAIELNNVDLKKYPAPHLTGTVDLQEIVYRGMFLHAHRLRFSESDDSIRLQFGDVIRWKEEGPLVHGSDVFLVVTPACDLARDAVDGVVLLSGDLQNLEPTAWSYKQEPVRTPVVICGDEQRWWIKWDLKAVRVVAYDSLKDVKEVERIGRLREIHAIDLQQRMLATLGRVGTPASSPVAFAVEVSLYYVDTDSNSKSLSDVRIRSAACYVGRDENSKPVHRLVLGEHDCDEVERGLQSLSDIYVRRSAHASLSAIREGRSFFDRLERGEIEMPLSETRQERVIVDNRLVAVVIRSRRFAEGCAIKGELRNAALIIQVVDVGNADV